MTKPRHPNSLKNLTHEGRPLTYGEAKHPHRLSVTDTGWNNVLSIVKGLGISVSELIEQIGRGRLAVIDTDTLASIDDALDSALLRQAVVESNNEFTTLDALLAEQGLTRAELNE